MSAGALRLPTAPGGRSSSAEGHFGPLVSENVLEPILALVQAAFGLFQLISWWDGRKRPQGPKPWSLSWCCIRQIAQAVSQQREAA